MSRFNPYIPVCSNLNVHFKMSGLFWYKFLCNQIVILKTFEGEVLIRTQPTTPLQILSDLSALFPLLSKINLSSRQHS